MRILVVYPYLLESRSMGGLGRVQAMVRHFARRHEVSAVTFDMRPVEDGSPDLTEAQDLLRTYEVIPAPRVSASRRLVGLLAGISTHVQRCRSQELVASARRIAREQSIQLLHVEVSWLAPVAAELSFIPARVLAIQELNSRALRRDMLSAGCGFRLPLSLANLLAFRRMEARFSEWYDLALAITPQERDYLIERHPGLSAGLYPHLVDTKAFPSAGRRDAQSRSLVFVGDFLHAPNAHCARWFARRVLPLIRRERPDVEIDLVGPNEHLVSDIAAIPGVRLTGFEPNLNGRLQQAAVFVAPIRSGGGMRGKLLEAMAAQVPIVATNVAVEGIEAENEKHLLIADEARAFAHAVLKLLRDPALARSLAENAGLLVQERYDSRVVLSSLEQLYESLVEAKLRGGERSSEPAASPSRGGVIG